jgi:formylglycine-generating enzyme
MLKDKFNIESQMIAKMKEQLGHIFDVDEAGNFTLKPIENIPSFKMIYVQGGEFTMGDENVSHNKPHLVRISSFFIGEFPVTQELYFAANGKEPSNFQGVNHPVEKISWYDAVDFCNLLNEKIGMSPVCNEEYDFIDPKGKPTDDINQVSGFRLPSEAEWECAAVGSASVRSTTSNIYVGSNHLDEVGWYDKNNDYETKPVGLKFSNELGIYDMSGNVWEYCWDCFEVNFYHKLTLYSNPVNTRNGSIRAIRGGACKRHTEFCRMAGRSAVEPASRVSLIGFRLAFAFHF